MSGSSRLTSVPTRSAPRLVRRSVSGNDVCEEDRAAFLHYGQAAPVDCDAAADLQMARDPSVVDPKTVGIRQDDLGDRANYPGEHPRIP